MVAQIVGIDLGKSVFHLHGIDDRGKEVFRKRLTRRRLGEFIAKLPACLIAMEACGGAHYWARRFREMGHVVKLIAPQYVKGYVKTNKHDAGDAAAVSEAASRAHVPSVPVKSEEAQALCSLHRVLARRKKARTALVNELRSLLLEFGLALPKGIKALRRRLWTLRHPDGTDKMRLPEPLAGLIEDLLDEWTALDAAIARSKRSVQVHVREDERCRRLMTIPGIGPTNASALVASIGNGADFQSARQFAAWLGLVPRQHSTGGKTRLLGISKRGDPYLRYLIVHAARAAICHVERAKTPPRDAFRAWIAALIKRKHKNVATLAVANKLARIIWAQLRDQETFAPELLKQAA